MTLRQSECSRDRLALRSTVTTMTRESSIRFLKFVGILQSLIPGSRIGFYFLSTDADTLKMVAFCLCRTREIDAGMAYPDPHDMQAFMITHFDAINCLFNRFHLDEAMNEEISGLVADYFYPRKA